MKEFNEFSFANNSTPTTEVQEFIDATMRKILDIQKELRTAILDYKEGDELDAVRFGLRVAETERKLKWLADTLEIIHNNSVVLCLRQQQEGDVK